MLSITQQLSGYYSYSARVQAEHQAFLDERRARKTPDAARSRVDVEEGTQAKRKAILDLLSDGHERTIKEIFEPLGMKRTQARNLVNYLINEGSIKRRNVSVQHILYRIKR